MPILFAPKRGAILMCNFDTGRVVPEMPKVRQVVVVSSNEQNHRHAKAAGTCTVVPCSSVPPNTEGPEDVFFAEDSYWSFSVHSWVRCRMVTTVSHDRLELVIRDGKRRSSEFLGDADMQRLMAGIKAVLDLP